MVAATLAAMPPADRPMRQTAIPSKPPTHTPSNTNIGIPRPDEMTTPFHKVSVSKRNNPQKIRLILVYAYSSNPRS